MNSGRGVKAAFSRKNLWERAGPRVRGLVGHALSVLPPAHLLGSAFRRHLRFLRTAERWSREQAAEHQLARVRQLCALAGTRSAFYKHAFDQAGFDPAGLRRLEDLRQLPTIDKQTLRENLDQMCTVPPEVAGADYVSTGGTGGTPLHFYIDAGRSAVEYAHLVSSWGRVGYRLGDRMAVFRGRVVSEDRAGLRHEYDPLLRHHYYSSFHMTDANMRRYLEHVRGIGPCFLHVYPSSVDALARFVERSGMPPPSNVRGIIAESEMVYPEQRRRCEAIFACRYLACYGHSEKLVLASECEGSHDYHVWPTYGFFELLDEQGGAVTRPGESGEIVATGFINTVLPFIRYRTGDRATYVADHCERCGRAQTVVREIAGHRTQELLVAADGAVLSWTALNMHDDTFRRVRRFQFCQERPGLAVLKVVPAEGFQSGEERHILDHLRAKLAGRLEVTILLCDEIALTRAGKATYVDQRIDGLSTR